MSLDTLGEVEGGGPVYWEPDLPDRVLIVVPAGGIAPVDLVMAPAPPSWFHRHVDSVLKLWVEMTYRDLGSVETHVRWFEFRRHSYQPYPWYVSQVLRSEPHPFKNLPPALQLIQPT